MAEFAAISLAACIVNFADFGIKVVLRLHEFRSAIPSGEEPKPFRDTIIELPLLIDTLRRTREQAENGQIREDTARHLIPVVQGCHDQIKQLDEILQTLPNAQDSSWKRGVKALASVGKEKKFVEVAHTLKEYVQFLTYHQAAAGCLSPPLEVPRSLVKESSVEPVFLVPFERDDKFVGRSELVLEIDRRLQVHRRVALAGIGGVGKSQIAIEYCYNFREENPMAHVFWVHASTILRLRQAYKSIAKSLRLPGWDDLNIDTFELIRDWLSNSKNADWLLVLDNADDINIFYQPHKDRRTEQDDEMHLNMADYLPRSPRGAMLVTTRDRRLGERLIDRERVIAVEAMIPAEAEQLLYSRVREDDEAEQGAVKELLVILGNLPLAITQAAAFISENDITISEYLAEIKKDDSQVQEMLSMDLRDHRRYSDSGSSIISTWKLSFSQINKQQPLAAEILSLMAVMDLHGVPKYLLVQSNVSFANATAALGTLKAFSLITSLKGGKEFEMHRLVQLAVRHWLELQGTIRDFERSAMRILSENFPFGDYENWKQCEQLSPHAYTVLHYLSESHTDLLQRARLLHNLARYNDTQGKYPLAHSRFSEALDLRKKLLGAEHPETIETASCLGEVLFREAKYTEGEEVMRYALDSSKKVLGLEHPLTRTNMGHLAEMNTGQGRFDVAEDFYRGALKGKEEELGTEMVDLKNADNLGAALRRKGDLDEAESWIRRSMIGREQSVGPHHPQTLRAINHLGLVLHKMGRYEEAELLNRRALAGFEKTLGREHHFTLQSLDNLSAVFRSQGKSAEAEREARRAHAGLERLLGPDHRHTLQSLMSIALALESQDRLDQAEELAQRAVAGEEKTLGSEHPQIRVSAAVVERILRKEGRDSEANELRLRLLRAT